VKSWRTCEWWRRVSHAAPLLALAREHRIEMPITEQVDAILHAGSHPRMRFGTSWNGH